ncbi:AAA family ATPase [Candidatus Amarolinea dominans]|uniref:AAA family ATPase n=1 Tax=Candidatus Amarolinea dominans TaxID=3140696 RepID=UPI003135237C|nr:AAA family ATPase [Anaerolineae bacterium]
MITRIELSGFKTFQDFELELAPFQVIVGANGAGKSNLFDALRLLSRLADSDLRSAFHALRGEAGELFTTLADGQPVNQMRLAVEMLVERQVRDSWGAQAKLKHPRLRYEVHITRRADEQGLERLYVTHESLAPIGRERDAWIGRYIGGARKTWLPPLKGGRGVLFISTTKIESGPTTISLHQDGHGGKKASVAEKVERTVLSGVTNTEFPHAFAAREEMRTWGFLQLNPEVLRQPSSLLAPSVVSPDGSNLASALARMQAEDPLAINDVSRDLANLVSGIVKIEIEKDQPRNRYVVWAKTQDGRSFSSRVLSDGTLRLLVLAALKNDLQHRGVLCFEEPENGVHPFRLKNMVELLRGLATDFSDPDQADAPLRQLLINTHSPVLVSQQGVLPGLLFAYMTTRVCPGAPQETMRVTRVLPVRPSAQLKLDLKIGDQEESYTLGEVLEYLNSADTGETRAALLGGAR